MLAASALGLERDHTIVFSNLTFELSSGEVCLITGANGSGKSSLLRVLAGLLPPSSGSYICNKPCFYLGHRLGLHPFLSVLEQLKWQARLFRQEGIGEKELQEILMRLELDQIQNKPCRQLSRGQQQRVALAPLWFTDRSVWLLDEPYTGLDAKSRAIVDTHLQSALEREIILVLAMHHPIEFAATKFLSLTMEQSVC